MQSIPDKLSTAFATQKRARVWADVPFSERLRIGALAVYVGVLTVLFAQPLVRLWSLAMQDERHSHTPLVPLITAYLLYSRRKTLDVGYRRALAGAGLFAAIALAALWLGAGSTVTLSATDRISATTVAYLSFVVAGGFGLLGSTWMAGALFPLAFLIFMVPMPDAATFWLETQSVLASADVSAFLFDATATPLVREGVEGTIFRLPGIALQVAQECSGIRSSWVLFITSVLASQVLLTSPWRRVVLVAFVIPLAIVRNSFRILVIGLLCVHVGPHMINSWIHHRGGPIFFVLSLVPLFLLLMFLHRTERRP